MVCEWSHDQSRFRNVPSVLKNCPGSVARLEEQVISPAGLIADLSQQHRNRLLKIDAKQGIEFDVEKPGLIRLIRITQPETHQQMELNPRHVIFTARLRKRRVVPASGALFRRHAAKAAADGDVARRTSLPPRPLCGRCENESDDHQRFRLITADRLAGWRDKLPKKVFPWKHQL